MIPLTELKALAEKVTARPWRWSGANYDTAGHLDWLEECSSLAGTAIQLADRYEGFKDDCAFIAACDPDTVKALVEVARAARLVCKLEDDITAPDYELSAAVTALEKALLVFSKDTSPTNPEKTT